MAEGSHGRDYRPSQGAFRSIDQISSNNPRIQQARRVSSSADHGLSIRHRIRSVALALGIIAGGGAGIAHIVDEVNKPPAETFQSYHSLFTQIDTNKYLIEIHKEGEKDLVIRHDPYMPDFDDRQEGKDNYIEMNDIVSVNGTAWDGKTSFIIENTPVTMATDPTSGILTAPWFAVELEHKSPLGDITKTVGFISHSTATDSHITPIESDGGMINARFENGQIIGKNEFGDTIVPTDQVGLATIAGHSVTTQVGNPQS